MADIRNQSEEIHRFIVSKVPKHPDDIAKRVAARFGISRQAVNQHLQRLVAERVLSASGATRNKSYRLRVLRKWEKEYEINVSLTESDVWARDIKPLIGDMPDNMFDILDYGFTEMFNNVLDHSGGDRVGVFFAENAAQMYVAIVDNGVGIFKKIQAELDLPDERHAPLELAKGKFTTDSENHSGEGIFFTSRMFDDFVIISGGVYFSHDRKEQEDWIEKMDQSVSGTVVWMLLNKHVKRTTKRIFDQFTSGDDYGFTKTVVPVRLAEHGDDKLVSRSQAKRLLVRIERFDTVIFDFSEVVSIGQAFADEIFRVFARRHPEIELKAIKTNTQVNGMIRRALQNTID